MKIELPYTQKVSIDIDNEKQLLITLSYLEKVFDWSRDWFIDNDKVKSSEVCYSSHSFTREIIIRDASDEDYFVAMVFNKLTENI